MRQVGLLEHYRRQSWPKPNRCTEPLTSNKPGGNIQLKLENLFSVFVLFGAGVLISLIAFIIELVINRIDSILAF